MKERMRCNINKIYTVNESELINIRESLYDIQYYLQDLENDVESTDTKESIKQTLNRVYSIYKIIGM